MERKIAEKYLITVLLLLAGSALLSFALVTALNGRGNVSLAVGPRILAALAAAVVTAGNYAGFVLAAMHFKDGEAIPKGVKMAACILFPVTVVLITLYGILMLVPGAVKAVSVIKRG